MKKEKYLNKIDLQFELIISQAKRKPTKKLLEFFDLIITGVLLKLNNFHPNYYELNKDKYQEAYYYILKAWQKIDPESNAFAYLTQIAINAANNMYNNIVLGYNRQKIQNQMYGDTVKIISYSNLQI